MRNNKLTTITITIFLRQFATLINAGIPLIQCCMLLENDPKNPALNQFTSNIKRELLSGKTLFQVFSQHKIYFDDFICQLIQLGEHTGNLDQMLNSIATHKENQLQFLHRIRQLLFYPCIITCTAILVLLSFFIFIIPRFAELFRTTNTKLPLLTALLFKLATLFQQYWLIILIISALITIIYIVRRPHLPKQYWQYILFRHPALRKIYLARFARNLAIAFSAGMPIHAALHLIGSTTQPNEFATSIYQLRRHINSGRQLHHAIAAMHIFPHLMVQMIKIGEECGSLDSMLNKIADFYEDDVNRTIQRISQLLEPLIMIVLGVLIGGLVIGMYLPIFNLGSAL